MMLFLSILMIQENNSIPRVGMIELEDAETGESIIINL